MTFPQLTKLKLRKMVCIFIHVFMCFIYSRYVLFPTCVFMQLTFLACTRYCIIMVLPIPSFFLLSHSVQLSTEMLAPFAVVCDISFHVASCFSLVCHLPSNVQVAGPRQAGLTCLLSSRPRQCLSEQKNKCFSKFANSVVWGTTLAILKNERYRYQIPGLYDSMQGSVFPCAKLHSQVLFFLLPVFFVLFAG